jgi:hypothetical protein
MIDTTQDPVTWTREHHTNRKLFSLDVEAELAESDHRLGHEYLPLDVFIDPITIKEHFRIASLCTRTYGSHFKDHH